MPTSGGTPSDITRLAYPDAVPYRFPIPTLSEARVPAPHFNDPTRDHAGPTRSRNPDHTTAQLPGSPPDATLPYQPSGDEPEGYAILREIARGGMGRVLAAHDLKLDREVALKVLLPGQSAADTARRFIRESKITAHLPHPGIPPVYALGNLPDGSPFLAMKLIEGRTLADELAGRRTPAEDLTRFLQVFEQVCQAVGFAHSQGIIHRDLKPANVMVGTFGEVQVMDWGLAKQVSEASEAVLDRRDSDDAGQTRAGAVMGTPAYMAPEQARGEGHLVGPRADAFALGAILCEILTGSRPFLGSTTLEVLKQAATGDLAHAFSRLDSANVDADLIALAKHCLSPNPEDRPANGESIAKSLAEYRADVEQRLRRAEAERATAAAEAREQRKRRRVQLALGAAILLLVGGGGAFAWHADRQETQRIAEVRERAVAERERESQNGDTVAGLLDRVESAFKEDDAAKAVISLIEAERRVEYGGVEHLQARLKQSRLDYDTLVELDRIDDFRWETKPGEVSPNAILTGDPAVPLLRPSLDALGTALARYGVVLNSVPAEECARRINASPIRERLLSGCEWWFVFGAKSEREAKLAILRAADPDPYRNSIRQAWLRQEIDALRELFDRDEALQQPARFAVVFAQRGELSADRVWRILNALGQTQPRNFLLLIYVGSISTRWSGMTNESISWFRAAVAVRPENSAAWLGLGSALAQRNDVDGTIACLRNAIRLSPKLAHAHYKLGEQFFLKAELAQAIAEYWEAIRLDARVPVYHHDLGQALSKQEDRDGAIESYRNAVRLDPNYSSALFHLGWALLNKGDPAGAERAFRELTRLNPNDPWSHGNLGIALLNKKDFAAAADAYREVIRLEPKSAKFRTEQGAILLAKGDLDAAIAAYRVALELDPEFVPAKAGLEKALKAKADREDK